MPETVTVTPRSDRDDDGNPVANGAPFELTPFAIGPGNTTIQYTDSGDVDSAEFTLYFMPAPTAAIRDGDLITVRGRTCVARPRLWDWQNFGGLEVLCESMTGAA